MREMRMLRLALAAVAAMGVVCVPQARADAIYTFTTTSFGTNFGAPGLPLTIQLDVNNAAIRRGSFNIQNNPLLFATLGGDVADLRTLDIRVGSEIEEVSPNHIVGIVNASFTFNTNTGALLTDSLSFFGVSVEANITGNSGLVGADQEACNSSAQDPTRHCFVSGTWTAQVPEPISLSLLPVALIGTAVMRRPRRA